MSVTGPFLDKGKRQAGRRKCWYLRIASPRLNPDGSPVLNAKGRIVLKRDRPHYETKEKAEADIPRFEQQHATAGSSGVGLLTREQLLDYELAKSLVKRVPLLELAKFWRLHHPESEAEPIEALVDKFLGELKALNGDAETRHYKDLKSRLHAFCGVFGKRIPGSITRQELLSYLLGLKLAGRTVLNHQRAVRNFFGWLVEKQIVPSNPASGISRKKLPKIDQKEIRFLSRLDATRYLRAAERYDPDLVCHEVIQLFSGVRADDEMADFMAEWVMPATREIVVPASVAKTERREVINELEPNFWAWWSAYGKKSGLLRPKNYLNRWRRLRYLATISEQRKADEAARTPLKKLLAQTELKKALKTWPWNARRRTFCTFHVAKHQSAERTALILRHRGGAAVLHRSYRGLGVTQQEGAAYFEIQPKKVARPIPPPPRTRVRHFTDGTQVFAEANKSA